MSGIVPLVASVDEEVDGYVAKFAARWPEWHVARIYLPKPRRPIAFAWFALLQEWTDAAWGGSDAAPGLAKLAWWQEELQGWARGARRHPLGMVLQKQPAPWQVLATALNALPATRPREGDAGTVRLQLQAFAAAVVQVEDVLLGDGDGRHADDATTAALLDALVDLRALHVSPTPRPVSTTIIGTRARRMQSAFVARRLESTIGKGEGTPLAPLAAWTVGWRAARGKPR